ncbi:MAG: hypothetical protein LBM73_00915 [Candidatus Nomurabacteria bacterium]|jgi:hypothetical protein|nr:hypothetical protein [Candidatus Nomurabacteria bacterium]
MKKNLDKIKPGQIWLHGGDPDEPYEILAVKPLDATDWENTGQLAKTDLIIYRQLYDGQEKSGTIYIRTLDDFFKNFTLAPQN